MAREEIEAVVHNGAERAGMAFEPAVVAQIVRLCQGFPHYAHLLAKLSAEAALDDHRSTVAVHDFEQATRAAVDGASESIKELYRKAVTSQRRDSLFAPVLAACAIASEASGGTFSATDLRKPLAALTGVEREPPQYSYNLGKLCTPERGNVIEKMDYPGRPRYRFRNPLLEPYVLLKVHVERAVVAGLVEQAVLPPDGV